MEQCLFFSTFQATLRGNSCRNPSWNRGSSTVKKRFPLNISTETHTRTLTLTYNCGHLSGSQSREDLQLKAFLRWLQHSHVAVCDVMWTDGSASPWWLWSRAGLKPVVSELTNTFFTVWFIAARGCVGFHTAHTVPPYSRCLWRYSETPSICHKEWNTTVVMDASCFYAAWCIKLY